MSQIALILAGHGSHISPNTAGIVWRYVDQLRAWGVADEITACFWKEEPSFSHVLDTVTADTIVIVPVFTAQGYFTQTVIPTEMGFPEWVNVENVGVENIVGVVNVGVDLSSTPTTKRTKNVIQHKNGKQIYYTPSIGEHPYLDTIMQERVRDTLRTADLNPEEAVVAVIGHGTRRNKSSRDATRQQAKLIRDTNLVAEVLDVYLDDDPDIPSLYHSSSAKNVIAIPYFLAEGSHVTMDVPEALGIQYGNYPDRVKGRNVYYTPPVGTDDAICRVILDLARDVLCDERRGGFANPPLQQSDNHWSAFPTAGRNDFMRAIESGESLVFGQVMVADKKVWHVNQSENNNTSALTSPEELRVFMREDPFRPLPTSDDLPMNWHVDLASAEEAYAVIETIYPSAIADWANQKNNTFITESLEDIGTRQVGIFQNIHQIEPLVIQTTVDEVCGRCLRQPSWLKGHDPDNTKLACKSACNFWLSSAIANKDKQEMMNEDRVHLSNIGDRQA